MPTRRHVYLAVAVIAAVGILFVALLGRRAASRLRAWLTPERPLPVSTERITADDSYTDVIFLHHSTGHNLIAEGNVRTLMSQKGYQFWDHDYNTIGLTRPDGSLTHTSYDIPELQPGVKGGGNTDPDGLAVLFAQPVHDRPDNAFSRLLQHRVLIFKSCFPNSAIESDERLAQLKVLYRAMRDQIDRHPDRLFVLLTSPPLHAKETTRDQANRARMLATWLGSDDWLAGHPNLFVLDLFDLLADRQTNMLRADYQRDPNTADSHPNALANQTIGPLFVDFVDRAVQTFRLRARFP